MKSCVVVTAAGRCTRMGCFKPMLPIAGQPAIVHLLHTYFSAGVSDAIVVTGYQHQKLIQLCAGLSPVSFVHNAAYMTTQMFDSICLGLASVDAAIYDRILITPADIPLVTENTIHTILQQDGEIVFPSYQLRRGHPLMIRRSILPAILQYAGDRGLKGALASLSIEPHYAVVNDPFILKDMDTPRDYTSLLQAFHASEVSQNVNAFEHVELSKMVSTT